MTSHSLQQKACMCLACSWRALAGTVEAASSSSPNLKFFLSHYQSYTSMPSTRHRAMTHACICAQSTRSLAEQIWPMSRPLNLKLIKILITGSYVVLHCCVTSNKLFFLIYMYINSFKILTKKLVMFVLINKFYKQKIIIS